MKKQSLSQIVDDVISELPLHDRVSTSHMSKQDAEILQSVFERYIRSKLGSEFEDEEFNNIMNQLWKRLRETHRLRVVR